MDLFAAGSAQDSHRPLADRMRPRTLDEYAGQDAIIGPGRLLRRAIQADQLSSLLFYGPPGTGKTTLARVIANSTKSHFSTLNAVLSGVKDIRAEIDAAKERKELYGRRTILFVDEVHRWNKSQQDALLPWVENGTFILIGATTENPFFEVNSALVSRSRVFQLKPLTAEDLRAVAEMTLKDRERGYGRYDVRLAPEALDHLISVADGDARSLLNALELAVETTPEAFPPPEGTRIDIPLAAAEESIQKKALLYDKEGDCHFDTISAFIKSLRGSDPDAALYWMARMIRAGEDPRFLFRRMLISAGEDIGMADPQALVVVQAAAAAYDRIGMPEGAFQLTQAALYLATAPKSNSALGYFDAVKTVEEEQQREVPNHLKDPSRDGKDFGHGKGYLYPHAYRDHWTAQAYLPEALQGRIFYKPSAQGYEGEIRSGVLERREEQLENALPAESAEILSVSPEDKAREEWLNRITSQTGRQRRELCRELLDGAAPPRHSRFLLPNLRSPLYAGEALRRAPEGLVWIRTPSSQARTVLEHYFATLDPAEKPVLEESPSPHGSSPLPPPSHFRDIPFEYILAEDWLTRQDTWESVLASAMPLLAPGGRLLLAQTVPSLGQRLSALPGMADALPAPLQETLRTAEDTIYRRPGDPLTGWGPEDLRRTLNDRGWTVENLQPRQTVDERPIPRTLLEKWLPEAPEDSPGFAAPLASQAGPGPYREIRQSALSRLAGKTLPWHRTSLILQASRPEKPLQPPPG